GHRVHIQRDTDPAAFAAAYRQARARLGQVDAIVHLDGLAQAQNGSDPEALLAVQVRRCALAAEAARALERDGGAGTLWLVTAGAAQHLAPGGASATPGDAALRGYGRTMINEAAQFAVRLLDLPDAKPAAAVLQALERELRWPDAEQEAALTPQGHRYAPRLRTIPRPAPAKETAANRGRVRLGFEFPGQLRNLRWDACEPTELAAHEIEIDVHATGLNFRDVMYALGLLSDEAIENGFAGPTLG